MAIRLTRKRERWAKPRNATLKGGPLKYPAPAAMRYQKSLDELVWAMRADYQREILKLWRQSDMGVTADSMVMDANIGSQMRILFSYLGDKWARRFGKRAKEITDRMLSSVDRHSKATLNESLKKISGGITIKVPDMPGTMAEVLKATVAENVSLITSISAQYQERIEGVVYRSIQQGGRGAADIYEDLIKVGGMSERRAHNIAIDQTRKATTAFNVERAKSVGIRKGVWRHSSGSAEPRKMHLELDGQEFDLENPPVIDPDGTRGLPGYLPNCRCFWTPQLTPFDEL